MVGIWLTNSRREFIVEFGSCHPISRVLDVFAIKWTGALLEQQAVGSLELIDNTTKTKTCAYFMGYNIQLWSGQAALMNFSHLWFYSYKSPISWAIETTWQTGAAGLETGQQKICFTPGITEASNNTVRWHFCHWLPRKLSFWQLPGQPATKIWLTFRQCSRCYHWPNHMDFIFWPSSKSGLILGLHPANEIRCYKVMQSLIGWAQTYNLPWKCHNIVWDLVRHIG